MSEEIKELLFLLHNDRLTETGKRKLEQEIERLTKQNKALNEVYELTKKEYIRLNNIINELEEYMIGKDIYKILLYKLRDLKESDKE